MPELPKRKFTKLPTIIVAKIANELTKGKQRTQIAKDTAKLFNVSPNTVLNNYLIPHFNPKDIAELTKNMSLKDAINVLLWRYRNKVLSHDDLSKIAIARQKRITPEQRDIINQKIRTALTSEQRSEIAKERDANMSPEKRRDRTRKAQITIGKERKIELGYKAIETRKKYVSYVDDLPDLNLLSKKETNDLLKKYMLFFENNLAINLQSGFKIYPIIRLRGRSDYKDIISEFQIAILKALKKWDKKLDLNKLVIDSVVWSLFSYFSNEKKQYYGLISSRLSIDDAQRLEQQSKSGRVSKKNNKKNY